jgi:hypothetical protein
MCSDAGEEESMSRHPRSRALARFGILMVVVLGAPAVIAGPALALS